MNPEDIQLGNSVVTQVSTDTCPDNVRLTKSYIDGLVYSKSANKQDIRWDDSMPCFGVRIYPSGKKSFIIKYRSRGRQHQMVLGSYPMLSLDAARDRAKKALVQVLDAVDPLQEKRKHDTPQSFAKLCELYIERHARPHKKTWFTDKRRIEIHLLPKWGHLNPAEIKRSDVAYIHSSIGQKFPYEANRVKEIISKIFELAVLWGFVDEAHRNPARGIPDFKEIKRDRYVTHDEMPRLAAAIEQEENVYVRNAIWFLILTGLRKREALNLKWSDINWGESIIRIGQTKSGRPHYLPLSADLIDLLRSTPTQLNNEFVFVGHIKGKQLNNIDKPWDRIQRRSGLEDLRIHDLRRTVGSWLAQSGVTLNLIGKVLNQTTQQATEVYARFRQDDIKKALEQHQRKLRIASKGLFPLGNKKRGKPCNLLPHEQSFFIDKHVDTSNPK